MPHSHQDLTRSTLAVLFIGGLIAASFWVMRPFLPAIIWAVTLVIASWPLMLRVQHFAGNRRGVAVLVMTVGLLLVLIVPLSLAVVTIVTNLDEIGDLIRSILTLRVPPPPDWLAGLPLIGPRAAEAWGKFTSTGVRDLAPRLIPYAGALTQWFVAAVGSLGEVVRGHRGPDRRALRVGDLVGSDAEDERLERASFVAVPRQGGQHGETDLLGHVVSGVLASGQPS